MKKLREEELVQVNGGDGYDSDIQIAIFKEREYVFWKGHGRKTYIIIYIYGNKTIGYRYALQGVDDLVPEGDLSKIPFPDI